MLIFPKLTLLLRGGRFWLIYWVRKKIWNGFWICQNEVFWHSQRRKKTPKKQQSIFQSRWPLVLKFQVIIIKHFREMNALKPALGGRLSSWRCWFSGQAVLESSAVLLTGLRCHRGHSRSHHPAQGAKAFPAPSRWTTGVVWGESSSGMGKQLWCTWGTQSSQKLAFQGSCHARPEQSLLCRREGEPSHHSQRASLGSQSRNLERWSLNTEDHKQKKCYLKLKIPKCCPRMEGKGP